MSLSIAAAVPLVAVAASITMAVPIATAVSIPTAVPVATTVPIPTAVPVATAVPIPTAITMAVPTALAVASSSVALCGVVAVSSSIALCGVVAVSASIVLGISPVSAFVSLRPAITASLLTLALPGTLSFVPAVRSAVPLPGLNPPAVIASLVMSVAVPFRTALPYAPAAAPALPLAGVAPGAVAASIAFAWVVSSTVAIIDGSEDTREICVHGATGTLEAL